MPEADSVIVQGNTLALQETLIGPDGLPLDLTGVLSRVFNLNKRDRSQPAIVSTFDVIGVPTDGVVRHTLTADETATAGWWEYEWQVQVASGQVITFPAERPRSLLIRKKIV